MARPREFDENVAIDRARNAFWEKGIAATSIAELSEATGLTVGSIYKAFESKSGLCHRTLDDYLDSALVHIAATLTGAPTAIEGLKTWLDDGAKRAALDGPTRGCYAVTCATELAESHPTVRKRLQQHDRKVRSLVASAIKSAVLDGDLSGDPVPGARMLLATMNGVQVEARKGIDESDAREIFALALRALE